MRYEQLQIIKAGAMSGNLTSSIIDLRNVLDVGLVFAVSGSSSPTGTAAIQFAEDCVVTPGGSISGGTWATDPLVAAPTITADGNKGVNIADVGHLFCRVVYTTGTGTGTLNVFAGTKGA